jgi:ribonuclease HI
MAVPPIMVPPQSVSAPDLGTRSTAGTMIGGTDVLPSPPVSKPALPHVQLFTDGACSGNPGPGGWAYVLRHPASGKETEASGAELQTTNNRMELKAVIEGLLALKGPSLVDLTSDSQYVLKGLKEWIKAWKARGWKTSDKKPVKNQDLWEALDELAAKHEVRFHWIRGHNEHPENTRADQLAVQAREALVRAS